MTDTPTNTIGNSLTTPETLAALPGVVDRLYQEHDAATAIDVLDQIQTLAPNDPAQATVAPYLPKIVLMALPLVSTTQLPPLVASFVVRLIDTDSAVFVERLTIALESVPLKERDALKKQLLDALSAATQTLTTVPVATQSGQPRPPTVGNWVSDWRSRSVWPNDAATVLNQHPTPTAFTPVDRQRLDALLRVLRLLTQSSTTLEGVEETVVVHQGGERGQFSHGRVTGVGPQPVSPTAPIPRPFQRGERGAVSVTDLHPDDQAEIAQHQARLGSMTSTPAAGVVADQVAENILFAAGVQFADPLLDRRARTIVQARLKGIRSDAETKDLLTRAPKIGGLGLQSERAQAVLEAAALKAGTLHETTAVPAAAVSTMPKVEGKQQWSSPPPPPPRPAAPPIPQPVPAQPAPTPAAPVFAARRLTSTPQPMIRPRPFAMEKTHVADIRTSGGRSRVVGPVDELRAMTLDEFRAGAPSTLVALQRLKGRFDVLAKESYALRLQAHVAWRQSPLYQLYVAMGQESMESRQGIEQVVQQRQQRNEPTLTVEEFAGVADLNRVLRM